MQHDEFTVFRRKSQKLIDIYKKSSEVLQKGADMNKREIRKVTTFIFIPHLFVNAFLILFFRKKGNRLEADSLL